MKQEKQHSSGDEFERLEHHGTVVGELWELIRENKKYWLIPLLVILLLLGLLIFLGSTGAGPFLYTLF
ncbi:DUF5989 family protein [Victivallis sp. Marseille-Q1083]|uniref:DUF5989 family protein n=1 Tax=Victivallis sp. Marseille-Q1083 TaxID=2717288 RepID=UPI0015894A3A|nr:DUF5989 family protein [Victivallis sp. Marseille-Q1083]